MYEEQAPVTDFSELTVQLYNRNAWSTDLSCGCVCQANGIIKKLQGDLKALVGKIKVKNTVTVSQEKVLQETTERLQREQRELQDTQHRLRFKEDEVTNFLSIIWIEKMEQTLHFVPEACILTSAYTAKNSHSKTTDESKFPRVFWTGQYELTLWWKPLPFLYLTLVRVVSLWAATAHD